MADSPRSKENLERIKSNIENSYEYFHENYRRFRDFRKYVFKETLNEQQRVSMRNLKRPNLEFNILAPYLSRMLGEFAMQEPSIKVAPCETQPISQETLDFVEGHIRYVMNEANKDAFEYEVFKDVLSGGFSVAEVWTDYANPMSFYQKIFLSKSFDPTLCGFDPLARAPHKGDGRYCFSLYPMTEDDFKHEFPSLKSDDIQFIRDSVNEDLCNFNWAYRGSKNQKILLVAEYFEKKKKKVKIVKLADGRTMTLKNYEKYLAWWDEKQFIAQPPAIIGEPRWTTLEIVCKYRLIKNQIIEYYETDYAYLPYVFIDGNSVILTQGTSNSTYQMTRPAIYDAKGAQDLKNFAGISLAAYLENMINAKYFIKKEAIPQEQDYIDMINDIQGSNVVVTNAFYENNPELPISEGIREIHNPPAPPEIMGAFQATDATIQTILGGYNSNLNKNDSNLSGKAVVEITAAGNASSMPYVVGYLQGLTHIGNIIADLIPKYLVETRPVPVKKKNGEQVYASINDGSLRLDYSEHAIKVHIDAGVNFQVEKNRAVEQIIALMGSSETLSAFFNDEDGGLPILARNLTIYGADELPDAIKRWSVKKDKMQAEQAQLQQQQVAQSPEMMMAQSQMLRAQTDASSKQADTELEVAKLEIDNKLADAKVMEAECKIGMEEMEAVLRLEESKTSRIDHSLDAAAKFAEIESRQHEAALKAHELSQKKGESDE